VSGGKTSLVAVIFILFDRPCGVSHMALRVGRCLCSLSCFCSGRVATEIGLQVSWFVYLGGVTNSGKRNV
jgi:hypothetical protein